MSRAANPRYADQLAHEAGWMFKHSAPSQKILALALHVGDPWISRQCSGHQSGPVARFFETVRELVAARSADPGHVIAGALAAAVDEALNLTPAEIERRLFFAVERETDAQAEEDRASMRLYKALTATQRSDTLPTDFEELDAALLAQDDALQDETAWQINCLIYNRALQVSRGMRVAP